MSRWLPVGVGVVPLVWALFALDTAILGGVTPRAAAWTDPWPLLLLAMLPVWASSRPGGGRVPWSSGSRRSPSPSA